jgi:FADH2 O2-dependent halogenase
LERARAVRDDAESHALSDEIRRFIEPFNVAGLGDPQRRNWYPADAEDMLRAAPKLGVDREEVARVLERCGFHAGTLR